MSLQCPKCGEFTSVKDSRSIAQAHAQDGLIRRRRKCNRCDHRFTTFELTEDAMKVLMQAQYKLSLLQNALNGQDAIPKFKSMTKALTHFSEKQ